ncbi:type III secretion protein HrpV [Pseudomonas sp. Z1-12]|uniref:type III secretion protein HrpV n=1 Tax=Pseudomonas sp. Z1-12 TaxID=2817408 RepID=UPI003DA9DD12
MIEVTEKAAFYARVAARRMAVWPVAKGVVFASRCEHHDWGIALHIGGRALRPEQLNDALQRRFTQAEQFNHYYLFLDVRNDLVVWHAVSDAAATVASLDEIRGHALQLAGLDHLGESTH